MVQEAADAKGMSPAGFAREIILSAIQTSSTETVILEKLCETEFLLRQFFGGLFSQLSDKNSVMTHERFMKALSVAPGEGRKLAAELLSQKLQEGTKSDQQSA